MDDDVRFTLRMPKALHEQATEAAAKQRGQSLNALVVDVLSNHLGGPKDVYVAIRQAEASLRAARRLLSEDQKKTRVIEQEAASLFISFQIVGDLAEAAGITQEQYEEQYLKRFDELYERWKKEKPEREERWARQIREEGERARERLEKHIFEIEKQKFGSSEG
jgi:hypothetical protein